jgi:hypothetical protein
LKYADRHLDVVEEDLEKFSHYVLAEPPSTLPHDLFTGPAVWVITMGRGLDKAVSLQIQTATIRDMEAQTPVPPVRSEPCICYPCLYAGYSGDFPFRTGPLHWLLRALAGSSVEVGFADFGRVRSNFVLPYWLVQRSNCSDEELYDDVRATLPCIYSEEGAHGLERYAIHCAMPGRPMAILKDWRIPQARAAVDYGPQYTIFLETRDSQKIPMVMFCSSEAVLCEECAHAVRRSWERGVVW